MILKITKKDLAAEVGVINIHLTPTECGHYNFEEQDFTLTLAELKGLLNTIWESDKCLSPNWYQVTSMIGKYASLLRLWSRPYLLGDGQYIEVGDIVHNPRLERDIWCEERSLHYRRSLRLRKKLADFVLGTDVRGYIEFGNRHDIRTNCSYKLPRKELGSGIWKPRASSTKKQQPKPPPPFPKVPPPFPVIPPPFPVVKPTLPKVPPPFPVIPPPFPKV